MNVDCRWWETSVVRGRVLAAGLLLLGAGCAVLGWGSRSRHVVANAATGSTISELGAPGLLSQGSSVQDSAEARRKAHSLLAGLPMIFEPNQGQGTLDPADPRARFVARGSGYSLFLGSEGAILSLVSGTAADKKPAHRVATSVESFQMKLAGANPQPALTGTDVLPGKSNYLIGNDPAKWRSGVPQYARVRYEDVYPGINLVFYGNQGHLEYDFQVAPGADPAQAELEFNGVKQLAVENGALVLKGERQSLRLEAPQVYQEVAGHKQPIDAKFVLRGDNRAGFAVGSYDRSRELIIDPILNFATYFGGSGDEHSTSVAVDGALNVYITGSTTSVDLPPAGGSVLQTTLAGTQNVYVAKITPPLGSIVAKLVYVTYLGGNGVDSPAGISVDGGSDVFVAGTTSSTNFPTTATTAYQTAPETGSTGTTHVFVTELNPTATAPPTYSTYLSGDGTDVASGMTIDASGHVFVTGTTTSQDVATTADQFPASTLPQALPYQTTPRAPIQFFVTKVNTQAARASSISYSTYFGGQDSDTTTPVVIGGGIAVDTSGNIYFSGTTNFLYTGCAGCGTSDFPILNAYQPCLDTPPSAVITNPQTCTTSTTTTDPDAFVAKLNPNAAQGQQLQWSTYLGGSATDSSTGVALDTGAANVYVVGTTNSSDFVNTGIVSTFASYQKCLNNNPLTTTSTTTCLTLTGEPPSDAFVARLTNPTNTVGTPTNVSVNYFSYLGGSNDEAGLAITVDSAAGALITGWTQSPNTGVAGTFPVAPNPNSIQSALNGTQDAFVARLNTGAVVGQTTIASWANYFGGSGIDSGTGIALDVNQDTYVAGETNSTDLQVAKPLPVGTTNSGGYDAFVTQLGTAVSLSIQGVLTLGTSQTYISAGNQATFTYTVTNNGPDLASGITVSDNLSSSVTQVPLSFVSATTSSGSCGGVSTNSIVSCTLASLQSGSTVTVTIVVIPLANSNGGSARFNGGTVQASGPGNIVFAQTSVSATMSDFAISVNPPNFSVLQAGDTAVYTVQLTPNPLYQSPISLSCTGTPANSSCNFTTSPVTLSSSSGATTIMNVATQARPVTTPASLLFTRGLFATWLVIPGLMVFGAGMKSGRRRRIMGVFMLCMLFGLLLFLPACSHTTTPPLTGGTPAGTYSITVTAASGSDTKSQVVSLTVP